MPLRSRILIVDDNERNVSILRTILGQDYALEAAGSGEEALAIAHALQPDLILLDIMMPGIDGYETCRRLRASPSLRWVKIIMVSARAMVSERVQGYDAGADDYVTKPFDEDELLAKVRVHLRLKSIEEVDALKTNILDLLQHETRTPLTGVIGPAQILMSDEPLDVDARKDFARVIFGSATRLHDLFQKVMTLLELKSGTVRFQRAPVDVPDVVRAAIAAVAEQAAQKHVTIDPVGWDAGSAPMDRKYIMMAVTAILGNAVRFSPPGGKVVVGLSRQDDHVRVTVTDRGPGIAPSFLPRVFDEFTDADLAHHSQGHGLSLAIVWRIIRAHDGTIAVESQPGDGTTFTLDLPLTQTTEASAQPTGASR